VPSRTPSVRQETEAESFVPESMAASAVTEDIEVDSQSPIASDSSIDEGEDGSHGEDNREEELEKQQS